MEGQIKLVGEMIVIACVQKMVNAEQIREKRRESEERHRKSEMGDDATGVRRTHVSRGDWVHALAARCEGKRGPRHVRTWVSASWIEMDLCGPRATSRVSAMSTYYVIKRMKIIMILQIGKAY